MSKINFVTLFVFILNIQNAISKNKDYIGVVYWRGFGIESITGIPESQINNYGMRRCISRNVFMELLFHIDDSHRRAYDDKDVRGSITFNNDVYYVNRSGIVRYENYFYSINKESFSHIMNQDKSKCPLIDKNNIHSK
ncbi:TPA: hypothetical protein ACQC5M_000523 [Escherichia albertii]|uniref:hypothetical protein n=1 Tax=Escherichia albertii TaxID=208962 RepID=UPI000743DC64|nr:hypothetical protein [Escherichia albertii]PFF97704.1 hypothetical protein CRH02_02455 [Escherichia albertii]HEB1529910.1 hypothetical protein [Escherichia albertii]HEB1543562.1 hypothetical protein [Escherichia albertii]